MYAFQLTARELLEDGVNYGEEATAEVTLVITDVDDKYDPFFFKKRGYGVSDQ